MATTTTSTSVRMRAAERRAQILDVAAHEFADGGLRGASIDEIARAAGITQPYVFRIFGSKKALFLEVVAGSFTQLSDSMCDAAEGKSGLEALSAMGERYNALLADRTALQLQLQAYAACGDLEVREAARDHLATLWDTVATTTRLDPVTVKTFLAFGMLLNTNAALGLTEVDARWARGIRTRIRPGLFRHITSRTNR
jgi:AcrR family transcriptional regulator